MRDEGIDNYRFSTYIVSAAPKECVEKAVEHILPVESVYGTTFIYKNDIVQDIERANSGHAKVATLDMLKEKENVPRDAAGKRNVCRVIRGHGIVINILHSNDRLSPKRHVGCCRS